MRSHKSGHTFQDKEDGDHDALSASARVAICVCTCRRPKLLERCLQSLADQLMPSGVQISIIVVDNDATGSARAIVTGYARGAAPFVLYVHQPRRGIAIARNTAIDAAIGMGTDWIAFIDDDETASLDWIASLMAPDYLDTPVLQGHQVYEYPEPRPFWALQPTGPWQGEEGKLCKSATTANVRFSAALVREGLRFDEGLGYMGGEDQAFFAEACRRGYAIRKTGKAVTIETVHRERATYAGQMYRSYWTGASDMRTLALDKGRLGAALRKGHTVPIMLIHGSAELIVSPLCILGGLNAWRRRTLAGGKKIAKAFGRAAGLLGRLPQPYRVIVGE